MRYRYRLWQDKVLLLALIATFFAFSSYVRVAIRAILEGPTFQWAYFAGVKADGSVAVVFGRGIYGDFDFVLTSAFLIGWLMWSGLRRPDSYFRAALFGWTTLASLSASWLTFGSADRLTSGKETLGLTGLSYFWAEVLPILIAWLLALLLLLRPNRNHAESPLPAWDRINTRFTFAGLACIGLAAIALKSGPQHGGADFAGIGLIYLGLVLIWLGASPWERRVEASARS